MTISRSKLSLLESTPKTLLYVYNSKKYTWHKLKLSLDPKYFFESAYFKSAHGLGEPTASVSDIEKIFKKGNIYVVAALLAGYSPWLVIIGSEGSAKTKVYQNLLGLMKKYQGLKGDPNWIKKVGDAIIGRL